MCECNGFLHFDFSSAAAEARAEKAEKNLAWSEDALARSEALARSLEESLRIANRKIWEVSAESAAYRDLATAMVQELSDPSATRRLTDPENRDGRRGFFERRKEEATDALAAANAHLKYL